MAAWTLSRSLQLFAAYVRTWHKAPGRCCDASERTRALSELYSGTLAIPLLCPLSPMHGLPEERVDYIGVAFVLIWHIIDTIQPKQVLVSKYAMKEGVLSTFLD